MDLGRDSGNVGLGDVFVRVRICCPSLLAMKTHSAVKRNVVTLVSLFAQPNMDLSRVSTYSVTEA
jgi:hypothetical protein